MAYFPDFPCARHCRELLEAGGGGATKGGGDICDRLSSVLSRVRDISNGSHFSSWGDSRLWRSICRDKGEGEGERVLETPVREEWPPPDPPGTLPRDLGVWRACIARV